MNFRNTLWQSSAWQKLQESLGAEVKVVEGIRVVIKKLPQAMTYLEIQRAPNHFSEKFWQSIKDLGNEKNSIFVNIIPENTDFTFPSKVRTHQDPHFPEATLVLDLSKSTDELRSNMRQSGRRHLKKAEASSLTFTESVDVKKFADFIDATGKRQGFRAHGEAYFQKMLECFDDAKLLVVKDDKKWLAAGIFIFHNHVATYYYGASSADANKTQAPTLLQWEAIKLAQEAGMKWYDFLGIAPPDVENHRLKGVTQFKQKFGGEIITYAPESIWVLQPIKYWIYTLVKKSKNILRRS